MRDKVLAYDNRVLPRVKRLFANSRRVAQRLGARLMVCGHAYVEQGAEAVSPELLLLNSDHARGVAVEIPLDGTLPSAAELAREAVFLATVGFEG